MKRALGLLLAAVLLISTAPFASAEEHFYELDWKTSGKIRLEETEENGETVLVMEDLEDAEPPVYSQAIRYFEPIAGDVTVEFDFKMTPLGKDNFPIAVIGGNASATAITFLEDENLVVFNHSRDLPLKAQEGWNHLEIRLNTSTGDTTAEMNGESLSFKNPVAIGNVKYMEFDLMHNAKLLLNNWFVHETGKAPVIQTPAETEQGDESISVDDTGIRIEFDGKRIEPETNRHPILYQGNVMTHYKAAFEDLKAWTTWDAATREIKILYFDKLLCLPLNSTKIKVNDAETEIAAPVIMAKGRIYVPLRAVAELLGAEVAWDGAAKTVRVTSAKEPDYGVRHEPRTAEEQSKVWVCPQLWKFHNGSQEVNFELNTILADTTKWPEVLKKTTGVKMYVNLLNPVWGYDMPALAEMIAVNNLETAFEVGGIGSTGALGAWQNSGKRSSETEISVYYNNWLAAGGKIDYLATDHSIMQTIGQYDYDKGLYWQAIYQQMMHFKYLHEWNPEIRFGLIESLGYFNIKGLDGYEYKQVARLADTWDFEQFIDDVLLMADKVGVTVSQYDFDFGYHDVLNDTKRRYDSFKEGDELDMGRIIAAQTIIQKKGLRAGPIFNDYQLNLFAEDQTGENPKPVSWWDEQATKHMLTHFNTYLKQKKAMPDDFLLQVWDGFPSCVGPEDKENTFFYALKQMSSVLPDAVRERKVKYALPTDESGFVLSPFAPSGKTQYYLRKEDDGERKQTPKTNISSLLATPGKWSMGPGVKIEDGVLSMYKADGTNLGYDEPFANIDLLMETKLNKEKGGYITLMTRSKEMNGVPWGITQGYQVICSGEGITLMRRDTTEWATLKAVTTNILGDDAFHKLELVTEDSEEGVLVSLSIDGNTVLNYNDTARPIYDKGYLVIFSLAGTEAQIK